MDGRLYKYDGCTKIELLLLRKMNIMLSLYDRITELFIIKFILLLNKNQYVFYSVIGLAAQSFRIYEIKGCL